MVSLYFYSLCLGPLTWKRLETPVLTPRGLPSSAPGWGAERSNTRAHSCAERTTRPVVHKEVHKARWEKNHFSFFKIFSIFLTLKHSWRNFFPQQQVVEINHTTTPLSKKVSLNLPSDRSSETKLKNWRVNPVKRLLFLIPSLGWWTRSWKLKSSVEKYDEMSLHFLPRLQAGSEMQHKVGHSLHC